MNRALKRILAGLLLAALGILAFYSLRPKPVVVDTARVTRGALQVTIDEDGQTRAHDRFTLNAPVAGVLSRITLHEGDSVAAHTVIAVIQPLPADPRETEEIRARIASAQALKHETDDQVARAVAAHEQAQRDLDRAKALLAQGIVARERFEEVQSKEETLAREVDAARHRSTAAAADVQRAEAGLISLESSREAKAKAVPVRAPLNGRILQILQKSEGVIASGTPLMVISNTEKLEVVADLLSTDAMRIEPGADVLLENWGGDTPLRGRVRNIEPFGFTKTSALGIQEQRVNVIVDFIEKPPALGDGYRVDVRIVEWESSDVMKVPASALFRVGEAWNVFVVEAGSAHLRAVDVGHRNAQQAEITKGLNAGEEVILHPSNDLKDGTAINPR